MSKNRNYDIIIVGGGMVGGTAACALARSGLHIAVIDAADPAPWQPGPHGMRVSAVNLASVRLFDKLGLWPHITDMRMSPYHRMVVWDAGSPAKIEFDALEIGEPALGYIVENDVIVTALTRRMAEQENITLLRSMEIENLETGPEGVAATLRNRDGKLRAPLLIGADGPQSFVRKSVGIQSPLMEFHQRAIVTTVRTAKPHAGTAWQRFLPTGPLAFLPLSDGSCSIVWSCDDDFAQEILALDNAAFRQRLAQAFESRLGEITDAGPRVAFPLRRHHAPSYIAEHTALIGDAAHLTHPLAGLGANIGFVDAAALAEVVTSAAAKRQEIGSRSVLRRYERWRRGDNAAVLALMRSFKETFGARDPLRRAVRAAGFKLADNLGPLKSGLVRGATGTAGDLPTLCR
ncbi:MAG: UbiH/UbiF/VisC/COQ6 family ubiquinone biosynthesis hydroxylase [Pseudomonadota bacterium]|nr:UbiH/UbiF/VisC/COQ6 family ubiquinone biosynthesis hydroxylase [Pseudomonadota bacterium]